MSGNQRALTASSFPIDPQPQGKALGLELSNTKAANRDLQNKLSKLQEEVTAAQKADSKLAVMTNQSMLQTQAAGLVIADASSEAERCILRARKETGEITALHAQIKRMVQTHADERSDALEAEEAWSKREQAAAETAFATKAAVASDKAAAASAADAAAAAVASAGAAAAAALAAAATASTVAAAAVALVAAEQISGLQAEVKYVKQLAEAAGTDTSSLRSEISRLSTAAATATKEITCLTLAAATATNDITLLRSEKAQIVMQAKGAAAEILNLKSTADQRTLLAQTTSAELATLITREAALKTEIAKLTVSASSEVAALNAELVVMTSASQGAEIELKSLKARIVVMTSGAREADAELREHAGRIVAAERIIAGLYKGEEQSTVLAKGTAAQVLALQAEVEAARVRNASQQLTLQAEVEAGRVQTVLTQGSATQVLNLQAEVEAARTKIGFQESALLAEVESATAKAKAAEDEILLLEREVDVAKRAAEVAVERVAALELMKIHGLEQAKVAAVALCDVRAEAGRATKQASSWEKEALELRTVVHRGIEEEMLARDKYSKLGGLLQDNMLLLRTANAQSAENDRETKQAVRRAEAAEAQVSVLDAGAAVAAQHATAADKRVVALEGLIGRTVQQTQVATDKLYEQRAKTERMVVREKADEDSIAVLVTERDRIAIRATALARQVVMLRKEAQQAALQADTAAVRIAFLELGTGQTASEGGHAEQQMQQQRVMLSAAVQETLTGSTGAGGLERITTASTLAKMTGMLSQMALQNNHVLELKVFKEEAKEERRALEMKLRDERDQNRKLQQELLEMKWGGVGSGGGYSSGSGPGRHLIRTQSGASAASDAENADKSARQSGDSRSKGSSSQRADRLLRQISGCSSPSAPDTPTGRLTTASNWSSSASTTNWPVNPSFLAQPDNPWAVAAAAGRKMERSFSAGQWKGPGLDSGPSHGACRISFQHRSVSPGPFNGRT